MSQAQATESTQVSIPAPASLGRELLAVAIGVGVAFACLLPPIIHFVSGPLGPLIGGFVAARYRPLGTRGKVLVAAGIGLGIAAIVGTAATIVAHLDATPPSWFPADSMLGLLLLGVAVYGAALASLGVGLAAATQRGTPETDNAN